MKKQNGITLIALVITIIVLLILAGVSIAMLTGDNGILTKATESQTASAKAEVMERINMELNAQMANAMAKDAFDTTAKMTANIGTVKGYTITVADQTATEYSEDASVSISVTPAADFETATGTVTYNETIKVWEVTPIKVAD